MIIIINESSKKDIFIILIYKMKITGLFVILALMSLVLSLKTQIGTLLASGKEDSENR